MYGEDEALAYDALYRRIKDYGAESAEVASIIRSISPRAKSVLDVGCGTGNHLARLARVFSVEGVEPSAAMAAIARRRLSGRRIHEVDMRELDLGRRFDAVICLYSSIGYMPSPGDLDRALAAMAGHVNERGVVIVEPWLDRTRWLELEEGQVGVNMVEVDDEVNVEVDDDVDVAAEHDVDDRRGIRDDEGTEATTAGSTEGSPVESPGMLVRMVRCWSEGAMSHMEMHYLRGRPGAINHFVEHHRLRLFSDDEYRAAFERAGLTVERREPGFSGRGLYVGVPARRNT